MIVLSYRFIIFLSSTKFPLFYHKFATKLQLS